MLVITLASCFGLKEVKRDTAIIEADPKKEDRAERLEQDGSEKDFKEENLTE